MFHNIHEVNKDVLFDLYVNKRHTISYCAKYFNISYGSMSHCIYKLGLYRTHYVDSDRKLLDPDVLKDLYIGKNMGMWDIARYLNVAEPTVMKNLKRYGITSHETSEMISSFIQEYHDGKSLTQIANKYNRPKSRVRKILLEQGVKLRSKYDCHCNDMAGKINNPEIFNLQKASWIKRRAASFFKNHISIPMRKENPKCSICGTTEHLHVHHLKPLSLILNEIVSENKGLPDEELYNVVINDKRYLDRSNMVVVCERCHYTVYHPYVKYHANQQPSQEE